MKSREELEREEWNLDHNYRVMKDFYRREREGTPEGIAWKKFKERAGSVFFWLLIGSLAIAAILNVIR